MVDHQKQVQFLPFNAINEFMRPDFRLAVVRYALQAVETGDPDQRNRLAQLTRKGVTVPGFRNSAKAPLALRVKPTAEAFEKSAPLVAAILQAWATARPELAQRVHALLAERGWEVLPVEAERAKLPGFMIHWPKGDDFETLVSAYQAAYPQATETSDEISLMAVWIGNRLPYDLDETPAEAS